MPDRPVAPALDDHATALLNLYAQADRRLRVLIDDAARRGTGWTESYRRQQLQTITIIIDRLQKDTPGLARRTLETAYTSGVLAVDRSLGAQQAFGGVHQAAVDVLVGAMGDKLGSAVMTVGRQADDLFRSVALKQLAIRTATGETTAAAARNIAADLTQQGVTAFVDNGGRRWSLRAYSQMVARTTTREAVTVATANRLVETGNDLVTVTSHEGGDDDEICAEYEGNTYSLTGATPGYDILGEMPPFHPNCRHVITPAAASFDDFAAGLGV